MNQSLKAKAEAVFADAFRKGMKEGSINAFKISHRTLYNRVIIPLLVEQMEEKQTEMKINTIDDLKPGQELRFGDAILEPTKKQAQEIFKMVNQNHADEHADRCAANKVPLYYAGGTIGGCVFLFDVMGLCAGPFYTFEAYKQLCRNTFE